METEIRDARLTWFGHLEKWDSGYTGERILDIELPGMRKRGRPQRRFVDVVMEDIQTDGVTEEDARYRARWRMMICHEEP